MKPTKNLILDALAAKRDAKLFAAYLDQPLLSSLLDLLNYDWSHGRSGP